jgi:16S rRNA (cytidine1402-2'-O)-methyltransferase
LGTLYLVATPIGNLEDVTARALRVLREVPLIAAEDTRHTGRLLTHFGIETPVISYHAHNERARRERLLAELAGGDLALVSDAGTPGISDPGRDLVAAALAAGHRVSPVPGPSALTAAVAASGLVAGPFLALGFLPRRGPERRTILARAGAAGVPVVLFEAPGRVAATTAELATAWGDRPVALMRELTKRHEEVRLGRPAAGLSPSRAAREAAAITGLPRSELYERARRMVEAGTTASGVGVSEDGSRGPSRDDGDG